MSTFLKLGNTILNQNPHNKKKLRSISLLRNGGIKYNNSINLKKTQAHFVKKSSSVSNLAKKSEYPQLNISKITKENKPIKMTNFNDFNYTTNTRFNKIKNFTDLNNKIGLNSFNRKEYIFEADKILYQRFKDKNADLLSQKNLNKRAILSDTREIGRNNYVIEAIRKNIDKINLKEKNYKISLINSEKEMKTDLKNFREFLDIKNQKIKEENEALANYRERHEQAMEKYEKELQKYKKLSEEFEKKIKYIWILKNYGEFIYKILGMKFWLEGLPEINQKTRNFEIISDLIIEKYNLLNIKEQKINEEEDFFDDGFLILKFKELEEKILQAINGKQYQMNQYKEKINNENTLLKMNTTLSNLSRKKNEVTLRKNRLVKNIDKSQNIKLEDETAQIFLEYIIELGKEAEKGDLNNIKTYFPNATLHDLEKTIKEYDLQYYTIKALNNLKKKETLINKFVEYIERIENSENRDIILSIEQERKNKNKKEKLKKLKKRQEQLHEEKNKRALERNTRFVVIGRNVPKVYQFQKNKSPLLEIKENKVKDDMELLYYDYED